MKKAQQKVVQYLGEAHATEQALTRDLQAQIAMTPRGSYRSALEAHLGETRDHASRVRARLDTLGRGSNPLTAIAGAAGSVVGQVVALGKAPLNLLRGSGGEEKLLKNAKDACAAEMLEIATYTALERLARSVGDDETARLAAYIRADEERMYERVRAEVPKLADAVVRAAVDGEQSFDVTTTGAAETVRKAATAPRKKTRKPAARPAAKKPAGAQGSTRPDPVNGGSGGDQPAAESRLRQAADSGDVHAAHRLGMLLWRERGNAEGAVEWLDRAAQADDPSAERDLGILLRDHGDIQGAHHWLSRAADRDGEARHALAELVESH